MVVILLLREAMLRLVLLTESQLWLLNEGSWLQN
jgi:hypothetical protein